MRARVFHTYIHIKKHKPTSLSLTHTKIAQDNFGYEETALGAVFALNGLAVGILQVRRRGAGGWMDGWMEGWRDVSWLVS